jgi:hypothetical protein
VQPPNFITKTLELLVRMSPFLVFAEIRQHPDFPGKDTFGHLEFLHLQKRKENTILHEYVACISE